MLAQLWCHEALLTNIKQLPYPTLRSRPSQSILGQTIDIASACGLSKLRQFKQGFDVNMESRVHTGSLQVEKKGRSRMHIAPSRKVVA